MGGSGESAGLVCGRYGSCGVRRAGFFGTFCLCSVRRWAGRGWRLLWWCDRTQLKRCAWPCSARENAVWVVVKLAELQLRQAAKVKLARPDSGRRAVAGCTPPARPSSSTTLSVPHTAQQSLIPFSILFSTHRKHLSAFRAIFGNPQAFLTRVLPASTPANTLLGKCLINLAVFSRLLSLKNFLAPK